MVGSSPIVPPHSSLMAAGVLDPLELVLDSSVRCDLILHTSSIFSLTTGKVLLVPHCGCGGGALLTWLIVSPLTFCFIVCLFHLIFQALEAISHA